MREGYKVRAPQDGYINQKIYVEGKKKVIQVPDPERAKFIITMFEMRASGQYTDQEIVDRINAMGYRTKFQNRWDKDNEKIIGRSGGHPLTVKKLQFHILKPIYCGVIVEKWTKYRPVMAKYPGLVSIDRYNAANRGKVYIKNSGGEIEILYGKNSEKIINRRMKNNPLFPYKFILCPHCKKPFLGSSPTGKSGARFPSYHCARKHNRFAVNKKDFDQAVESYINKLEFQPEILSSLHAVILDRYRERQVKIIEEASSVGHNVSELETQKAQAVRSFISANNPTLKLAIEKEIEDLEQQIKNAQKERNKLEITDSDIDCFIRDVKKVMEHPAEMLLNSTNIQQQRVLFDLVFEETPTYEEITNGTPKLSWIFKLCSDSAEAESQLVTLPGIEPGFKA